MNTQRFAHPDVVYCYDGTFDGFLCCVFRSVRHRELPCEIWSQTEAPLSLYPVIEITTDTANAARVYASIANKMNRRAQEIVTTCFLSGLPDKAHWLLRFLLLGYQEGGRVVSMLGDAVVAQVMAMHKQILNEAHQYKGFLRFEESEGMLGAVIAPKHYVLPLLRGHFCSRFPEEQFLIYDETHCAVLLYQNHTAEMIALTAPLQLPTSNEKESAYQALWKQFYQSIEIKERHNERCRQTHCPKRYWAHMTELKGEL